MTTVRQGSTFEINRILCPVDLSDFWPPVLAHAAALARLYRAEITALHVFAAWLPPAGQATYPGWMMQIPEARQSITEELKRLSIPSPQTATHSPRTADGDAATEIVRQAQNLGADLIVMGTHGRSGFDRFTLGSVREKVLREASCPVLTLPPSAARVVEAVEYRHILWPTDFSEPSERALELAVSMAASAKGVVLALHVVETILRMAADRNADVIVIGVRARGSVDLTLFGSTTNQVVRHPPCPVITLRGH